MPQASVQRRSSTGRLVSGVLVAMTLALLGFAVRASSEPERVPYLHLAMILQTVALLLLVSTRYVSAERPRGGTCRPPARRREATGHDNFERPHTALGFCTPAQRLAARL